MSEEKVSRSKKQLKKRVEFWQATLAELGLFGWDIHVDIVDAPAVREDGKTSAASAAVTTSTSYDSAWIEFERDFIKTRDQRNIDKVIVHELLHIVMRDFMHVVMLPEQMMPPGEYNQWNDLLDHEGEGLVERLARTIVSLHTD